MTQELTDLRTSILEGRYDDALALLDELEGMSRKAILRNIKTFLVRMLVHLIKNEVEQRLTNSWAASIRDSIFEIQDLNLMENKTSYYIKADEWDAIIENAFKAAISTASVEVANGAYKPVQLMKMVDKNQVMSRARKFLNLTYSHSEDTLWDVIYEEFSQLPGGEDWNLEGQS